MEGAEISGQSQSLHDLTEKTANGKEKSSSAGSTGQRLKPCMKWKSSGISASQREVVIFKIDFAYRSL